MDSSKIRSGLGWTFGLLAVIAIMVVPMFAASASPDSIRDVRSEGSHSILWFCGLVSVVLTFLSGQRNDWPATGRAIALTAGILIGAGSFGWAMGWFL